MHVLFDFQAYEILLLLESESMTDCDLLVTELVSKY